MRLTITSKPQINRILVPTIISSISFFVVFGFARLRPSNIAWLSYTDWQDGWGAYLGWESYRQSRYSSPIGLNYNYGLEIGNSVVYTDSIPLFSIPLKLLDSWLPHTFQFFGIWLFMCLMLQAIVSWKIISYFTKNPIFLSCSTLLFVFSPIMLNRSNMHMSQVAHFLILWGLLLNIKEVRNHFSVVWPILICISALVHPYFFAINLILFFANFSDKIRSKQVLFFQSLKVLIILASVGLVTTWQSGYFVSIAGANNPFKNTLFKMDLVQPINVAGWSHIFSQVLPYPIGNREGFNYLGLGIIILIIIAIVATFKNLTYFRKILPANRLFFHTALFIMFLYSLTYEVTFARKTILDLNLNHFWVDLFSSFRASGRFFAPVYYYIFIVSIVCLIKNFKSKISTLLIIIISIIQVADSSYYWTKLSKVTNQNEFNISQTYHKKVWTDLAKSYTQILILPPKDVYKSTWCDWQSIGLLVVKYSLSTNCIYFARIDPVKVKRNFNSVVKMLEMNQIPINTVVVLSLEQAKNLTIHPALYPVAFEGDLIYFSQNVM